MSTLSFSRTFDSPAFDSRAGIDEFDTLVRTAFVPASGDEVAPIAGPAFGPAFHTAFDLDYGDRQVAVLLRSAPCESVPAPAVGRPQTRVRKVRPVRQRVRITRRGRVVATLVFLGVALTLMATMGGWAVASLSGGTPESVRVVEVAPGETLYGIAGALAEPGEIREMVHRIQELNSLSGSQISEGQKLAVPRG